MFWLLALAGWPAVGFVACLPLVGTRSDHVALPVLLSVTAALTVATGWLMGLRPAAVAVGTAASLGASLLVVTVFLWYLFEVVGVS